MEKGEECANYCWELWNAMRMYKGSVETLQKLCLLQKFCLLDTAKIMSKVY